MRRFSGAVCALVLGLSVAGEARAYAADVFEVCRLDPNGDNFLALRSGPGASYTMLARLGPGTIVMDWERRGNWFRVSVGGPNGGPGGSIPATST